MALSAEFEIDVYKLYPVVTQFESSKDNPTGSDTRLAELIKEAEHGGADQPATASESKPESSEKPKPESEAAPR